MAIPKNAGPLATLTQLINRISPFPLPQFDAVVNPATRIGDPIWGNFFGWIGGGLTTYPANMPTYVRAYQTNADVYAIVSRISTKASSIPFSIKEMRQPTKSATYQEMVKSRLAGSSLANLQEKALGVEAFEAGSLPIPWERPNPYQTWAEFFALSEIMLLLTGNLYWHARRPDMGPNAGKPSQFYVLPSHYIQIVVKNPREVGNASASVVSEYLYTLGGRYASFNAADTFHMNFPGVEYNLQGSHLYGQSPLRAVLREVQSSDEASKNAIKLMKSGGAIGIIHGEHEPLDEEQAKQLKERLVEIKSDSSAMGQIAGISQKIGFTRIALPTKDLMPIEYDGLFQKKIANAYGFPTRLLNNDAAATYDNMRLAYRELIINRIMPDLNVMAETFNSQILPQLGPTYRNAVWGWDFEKLAEMQEDTEKLVAWGTTLLDRGVITRAELRQVLNFDQLQDTDLEIPTTNLNTIPLSEAVGFNVDPPASE